ncbi:hypothetical protein NECAME_10542 [Necator americanus]|uniref:Uncharacterized protein n=1 Tax=Necator americanus TaxID=51031 RepID=W2T8D3_NECAM|nr:hypothetical protein NECAME_10542 [Necator americanus]ETN78143.1 hypothetical protein NECAME_10542 [Necator americanus]
MNDNTWPRRFRVRASNRRLKKKRKPDRHRHHRRCRHLLPQTSAMAPRSCTTVIRLRLCNGEYVGIYRLNQNGLNYKAL